MSSPAFSAEEWSAFLARELERPVEVRFGRARRRVLVARPEGRGLRVTMNALFAEAPADVRTATARWLRSGKRARAACGRLDAWIDGMEARFAASSPRRPRVRSTGDHHDLRFLRDGLVEGELAGEPALRPPPPVTWGRRGRARRSLQLGSFDPLERLIRIHPVLDQPAVPRFFVRYVLFHELLHAVDPGERRGGVARGRRRHHPPSFQERERAYGGYARAIAWQEANLRGLLRSARTGKPLPGTGGGLAEAARAAQGWLFPGLG